jgi:hypothetical protein
MKRIFLLSLILTATVYIQAQTEADALRYSMTTFGGTARFMGTGGAFGALGADFSCLSVNPGGIGLYKKSEFSFTPAFHLTNINSEYNQTSGEDYKLNFNISNIGFVGTFLTKAGRSTDNTKGWKSIQFGFGLNRIANFNSRMAIMGINTRNSLLTEYADAANASHSLYPFDTELAYNADLLYYDTTSNQYMYDAMNGGIEQKKMVVTSGSMNEMVFSLGGNFNDRLYIGATIGLPFIRYKETSTYRETDVADTINYFRSFSLKNNLNTDGTGINLKLGFVLRITDWVRIGGAFHTPTYFYKMTDKWDASIVSNFDNETQFNSESPSGNFEYSMTTPMRAIGSIAFVIGKYGLISGDYEYVDYKQARIQSNTADFMDVNQNIKNNFNYASNIRVGAEIKLDPVSFRGGYALYGNPFKSGIHEIIQQSMTFGLGYRQSHFSFDIAYVRTTYSDDYYLYSKALVNPVHNDINKNNILLTFGLKF